MECAGGEETTVRNAWKSSWCGYLEPRGRGVGQLGSQRLRGPNRKWRCKPRAGLQASVLPCSLSSLQPALTSPLRVWGHLSHSVLSTANH